MQFPDRKRKKLVMEMFGSVILDDFRFQQRPIIIFSSGDQFENSAEIVSTIYCVLNSN